MYMAKTKRNKKTYRNKSAKKKTNKQKNNIKLRIKNLGKKNNSKNKKFNRIQYGCKMKGGGPEFNPVNHIEEQLEYVGSSLSNTMNGYTNNNAFAGVTNYP